MFKTPFFLRFKTFPESSLKTAESGFTYIEVIISMVIMLVGILGTMSALTFGLIYMQSAEQHTQAKEIANSTIETIFAVRDIRSSGGLEIDSWNAIQNASVSPDGIFLSGWTPVRQSSGADGIYGTADDSCPVGGGCSSSPVINGYERNITISDIVENSSSIIRKRRVDVIVRYQINGLPRTETVSTIIANLPFETINQLERKTSMNFIASAKNFKLLSPCKRSNASSTAFAKNSQRGFTLLELLVTVAVFLMVITAVFQLLRLATIQRNTVSARVDSSKSARIALNYMRRDILNAGFSYHKIGGNVPDDWNNLRFNSPATPGNTQDSLTSIVTGNNVNPNPVNATSPTDTITVVSRDLTFNNGDSLAFSATSPSGSDVLVTTATGGASNCQLYGVYLFETDTTRVVGMVTQIVDANTIRLGFGDPIGVNLKANGTGNAKSVLIGSNIKGTLKKINIVSYSVVNGTLIRRTFGNFPSTSAAAQIDTHELIYDVQDLQITYLMSDGTTTDDPSAGGTNQLQMNEVVSVEINLNVLQPNTGQPMVSSPVNIKEIVSTRNLHYIVG